MIFRPYDYQKKGIEWILTHPRCTLLWEMGLGKSVVTMTALQQLIDDCEISRTLVVALKGSRNHMEYGGGKVGASARPAGG